MPSVVLSHGDGVAEIRLNRAASGNAIDLDLAEALVAAVESVADDASVRCVLLTGEGRLFCAGGDVLAMAASSDPAGFLVELATVAHRAVLGLASLPVPVVAAVHGAAAGAGLALTLVSDIVLASTTARFAPAYVTVGLTPDCGTTWLLPRILGTRRALELGLTGRTLDAETALDWGLVTGVHDAGELESHARVVAGLLAAGPSPALGLTRRLLRPELADLAARLDLEAELIGEAATSPDAQQRIRAFVERGQGAA